MDKTHNSDETYESLMHDYRMIIKDCSFMFKDIDPSIQSIYDKYFIYISHINLLLYRMNNYKNKDKVKNHVAYLIKRSSIILNMNIMDKPYTVQLNDSKQTYFNILLRSPDRFE